MSAEWLSIVEFVFDYRRQPSLHWPKLPHNPYRKDGHSEPQEGRIEIAIPFDAQNAEHRILIEILD